MNVADDGCPMEGSMSEHTRERELLGNLLAVIHRDGGHRCAAVGWDEATREAIDIVHEMRARFDKNMASDEVWELRVRKLKRQLSRALRIRDEAASIERIAERLKAYADDLRTLPEKVTQ